MTGEQCPLCNGTQTVLHATAHDIEYFTSSEDFRFFHCKPCDILFISPMPYDRLNTIYPENYYSFGPSNGGIVQKAKEHLDRRALRALLSRVRADHLNLLDVGGGSGWMLDLARKCDSRNMSTQIIDIDAAARTRALDSGHRYFLGPIEKFETSEKFDLILMLNLIEHVRRPNEILAKARELLAPEGLLLIKTPNFRALDATLFRHRSWGGYHTPRHFVLFNRRSFARLTGQLGLKIERFSYTQGAPFWTVSVLNELRRAGLVSISAGRPVQDHPLAALLQAAFAGFDFLRGPFAALSQMIFVLARADCSS